MRSLSALWVKKSYEALALYFFIDNETRAGVYL